MIGLIKLVGKNKGEFVDLFVKYPTSEDDKEECLINYEHWKNDSKFTEFKIQFCDYVVDKDFNVTILNVNKEWDLPLEE